MKQTKHASPAATTISNTDVASQLGGLETNLSSIVLLTKDQRKALEARSENVPDDLIEQMLQIATKNGGVVAGIPLDVDATNATLTDVKQALAAATSSRSIAQKMEDDAVTKRAVVSDRIFAIYRALGRLVKTPEGNTLLRTYGDMASTVKNRPRRTRKKKPADASSATPTTATAQPATVQPTASTPTPAPVAAEAAQSPAAVAAAPAAAANPTHS